MNDSMRQRMETLAERGSPRGADAVLTSAQHDVHRRQRWLKGGFAVVVIALVAASVGAYGLARNNNDDPSTAVHTEPDQPTLTTEAPGDATALAQHMRTLQDAATRAAMGARARDAMLPLTAAAMTARLTALYEALLVSEAE